MLILEDHDCVHVAKGAFEVFNAHQTSPSKSVQRVHQILNLEVNHIMKGGYDHFMQKEIHEQPETLARTMQGRIAFDTASKVCIKWQLLSSLLSAPPYHLSACPSEINLTCLFGGFKNTFNSL